MQGYHIVYTVYHRGCIILSTVEVAIIACDLLIFLTHPPGDVTHLDIMQKHQAMYLTIPQSCYITSEVTSASLHNDYIFLHLLDNKTTILCLLQAKVKSIAPPCRGQPDPLSHEAIHYRSCPDGLVR